MNNKVIDLLNRARARELTAILQYMMHHYELEDADFGKLADTMRTIAIVEMKHAERLAERILFLGGTPTAKPDAEVNKGQAIPEMLENNKALEKQAIDMYNDFANQAAAEKDQVSKDLFESLLHDEEDHWNDFDNIKDHVDKLGASYLATLTGESQD